MINQEQYFKWFRLLLRYALWGNEVDDMPQQLSHDQYQALKALSEEQTAKGHISQALVDKKVKLGIEDIADVLSSIQEIRQLNQKLNPAVINLCRMMEKQGIRILILKGQTYAPFYPDPSLRQCGDIDFVCHPDDIEKAVSFLKYDLGLPLSGKSSNKHASFRMDGIKYEIHRKITNFAYLPSHYYCEKVFMQEVWNHPYTINVDGYAVPVMAPTYNAVYVFEHIFLHLISDGIGLRQFCDWALLLHYYKDEIDRSLLIKHLKGVRLYKAYRRMGSILVDYLGLPEDEFPLTIQEDDRRFSDKILNNIFHRGNFGHNLKYTRRRGPIHAMEHLKRVYNQVLLYYRCAPTEVLWRIPHMFIWWIKRIVRAIIPCKSIQSVFKRV